MKRLRKMKKGKRSRPFITRYVADRRLNEILSILKLFNKNEIKILDVGCGDGYITKRIRKRGYHIVGIDKLDPSDCKWMEEKPDFVMDATNMDFKDNHFDVVIALEVVEHSDCVTEIKRVLKPDGIFICSTPSPGTDWLRSILIFMGLLENQDFEGHDHIIDIRKIPMHLIVRKIMFLRSSQFGVFKNVK
jgi:2-polyprenyl-3-methyl-5-hydroxy-6-metoxy-1,4-benzoquinol methylase